MYSAFEDWWSENSATFDPKIKADCEAAWNAALASQAAPSQEPDINPETFLRLIETIKYMTRIAERGRGYPCPDNVLPERFLLEYVIELEGKEAAPSQEPVAWKMKGVPAYSNSNPKDSDWLPLYTHPSDAAAQIEHLERTRKVQDDRIDELNTAIDFYEFKEVRLKEQIAKLEAQRDELLETLEMIADGVFSMEGARESAIEALAKVGAGKTGEQHD